MEDKGCPQQETLLHFGDGGWEVVFGPQERPRAAVPDFTAGDKALCGSWLTAVGPTLT